jgi:ABC-type nitrate/sulfonate/bicarbonate transport system permease component
LRKRTIALAIPILVLGVWWVVSATGAISPLFVPSPREVVIAARDIGPQLGEHCIATLLRLCSGMAIGIVLGYTIGLTMSLFPIIRAALRPIVDSGRPAPMTATLPFFLLWFGFAWYGQVAFIALGVTLIIASAVLDAASAIPPHLIRVAQTLQASRWELSRTVLIPGLLPQLVPTLRICLGIAGSFTIVSELMGAESGLGTLLEVSRRTLRTEALVLVAFVLAFLVLSLDWLLRLYLAHQLRWMPTSSEAIDASSGAKKSQIQEYEHG